MAVEVVVAQARQVAAVASLPKPGGGGQSRQVILDQFDTIRNAREKSWDTFAFWSSNVFESLSVPLPGREGTARVVAVHTLNCLSRRIGLPCAIDCGSRTTRPLHAHYLFFSEVRLTLER